MRQMGNKAKLIEAATDLIHQKGYHTTTVDNILDKTGVKKSNFYYHFKSKEELALIALDSRIEQFEEEIINYTLLDGSISPKSRLKRFYKKISDYHESLNCERGCPFGNLAIEMSDVNEGFRSRLSVFFQNWESVLESCIAEGIKRGEFRSDIDPQHIASLLLCHLEGAIMMVKTYKTPEPLSSRIHSIMKLLEPI
ncbi:MAG: TetR/AcrR family transcriptional regulator [Candidatus Dadabacteria bacterium]|nr:TetR/AcrR family transcriptional regulator [Candidatus Dadabacteria bacterium]